jgi:hypothetical protein
MPNLRALSIVTTSSSSTAGLQVMPVEGELNAQLVISNAASLGGGTLHRWAEGTHSSRELKTDISKMSADDERAALAEVAGLQHVRFRYKSLRKGRLVRDKKQPMRRGLVYEEAPESIRRGGLIVIQERVTNLELGMKELMRQLEAVEKEAAALK